MIRKKGNWSPTTLDPINDHLSVDGDIIVDEGGLTVNGRLLCTGKVDVAAELIVSEGLNVDDVVDVGGYLRVDGPFKAKKLIAARHIDLRGQVTLEEGIQLPLHYN